MTHLTICSPLNNLIPFKSFLFPAVFRFLHSLLVVVSRQPVSCFFSLPAHLPQISVYNLSHFSSCCSHFSQNKLNAKLLFILFHFLLLLACLLHFFTFLLKHTIILFIHFEMEIIFRLKWNEKKKTQTFISFVCWKWSKSVLLPSHCCRVMTYYYLLSKPPSCHTFSFPLNSYKHIFQSVFLFLQFSFFFFLFFRNAHGKHIAKQIRSR